MEDVVESQWKEFLKIVIEKCYEGEFEENIGGSECINSRNGYRLKKINTSFGELKISIPRDRMGSFKPQIIKKHQKVLEKDLEKRIIGIYAKGMSKDDIEGHINEIYKNNSSEKVVKSIVNKTYPLILEWQDRPLKSTYSTIFIETIQHNMEIKGEIENGIIYMATGVDMLKKREIIGMWIGDKESSKNWIDRLKEVKKRGVKEILIVSVEELPNFSNAVKNIFPQTKIMGINYFGYN